MWIWGASIKIFEKNIYSKRIADKMVTRESSLKKKKKEYQLWPNLGKYSASNNWKFQGVQICVVFMYYLKLCSHFIQIQRVSLARSYSLYHSVVCRVCLLSASPQVCKIWMLLRSCTYMRALAQSKCANHQKQPRWRRFWQRQKIVVNILYFCMHNTGQGPAELGITPHRGLQNFAKHWVHRLHIGFLILYTVCA